MMLYRIGFLEVAVNWKIDTLAMSLPFTGTTRRQYHSKRGHFLIDQALRSETDPLLVHQRPLSVIDPHAVH